MFHKQGEGWYSSNHFLLYCKKPQTPPNTSNKQLNMVNSYRPEKKLSNQCLNYVLAKWLDFCWFFLIEQCHFLDNSCKSCTVAKPKEWMEFFEKPSGFNTRFRLTFCTLRAIFKQLNRWQSTPESGKTRKKKSKPGNTNPLHFCYTPWLWWRVWVVSFADSWLPSFQWQKCQQYF